MCWGTFDRGTSSQEYPTLGPGSENGVEQTEGVPLNLKKEYKKEEGFPSVLIITKLKNVNVGEDIFNVAIRVGQHGKYSRAAGAKCVVIKQGDFNTTLIRLPSGEIKEFHNENTCVLGRVFAEKRKPLGTAGANRRRGVRPSVKGIAMSPVDHPNGGNTQGGIPKTK